MVLLNNIDIVHLLALPFTGKSIFEIQNLDVTTSIRLKVEITRITWKIMMRENANIQLLIYLLIPRWKMPVHNSCGKNAIEIYQREGIVRQYTLPKTPQPMTS